jgi:polyferredoxin
MARVWRALSQAFFAVLFFVLVASGRIQLWMGIFLLSVVLAAFFGRFYCGWICPVNTLMNLVTRVKQRFHVKDLAVPESLKKPVCRYLAFFAFILLFAFVMVTGKKLPVLPGLLAVGMLLTFFFPESLWHRYLCPYGNILGIVGKLSKRGYRVIGDACISCGICSRVCPADAVVAGVFVLPASHSADLAGTENSPSRDDDSSRKRYDIARSECLLCGTCADKCPKKAVIYR